jgi:hypothetical protein
VHLQALKQQLPPVQQYMLAQVAKLSSSNAADRRAAVKALGEQAAPAAGAAHHNQQFVCNHTCMCTQALCLINACRILAARCQHHMCWSGLDTYEG